MSQPTITITARQFAGLVDAVIPFAIFYLGRTTTLVAYRDELGPGLDLEPALGIARIDDWVRQWHDLDQGYALMSPSEHAKLAGEHVPMRVVASDARRVLVAKR